MPAPRFSRSARPRLVVFGALAALAASVATPAVAVSSAPTAPDRGSEITTAGAFVERDAALSEPLIITKPIALGTVGSMVLDNPRQRIYVTGSDRVLVMDLAGNVLQTLTGHTGASSMVMVGSTLYIVEQSAIGSITLGTTAVNGPVIASGLTTPYGLAYAADALWTAVGPCSNTSSTPTASVARIALPSGTVTVMSGNLTGLYCPVLDARGTDLVVGDDGPQGTLRRFDLTSPTPTMVANTTISGTTIVYRVNIDSDSSTVLVNYGAAKAAEARDLTTLAAGTTYPAASVAVMAATSARGGLVALGGYSSTNITLYARGNGTAPMWAISVPDYVFDLAFSADGSKIYAYVVNLATGPQLTVIDVDDPTYPAQSQYGEFHPVDPARVFDSRSGARVAGVRNLQMTGLGGVPSSGVSAVAVNVTVADATSGGYLSLYPGGTAQPNASTVNYQVGQIVPNMAIVGVSTQGQLSVYTYSPTHVIIDVVGWFGDDNAASGGLFHPVTPFRWFDTRLSVRGDGQVHPVGPNQYVSASATGGSSTSSVHMSALALNVTATNTTSESYLTVTPFGAPLRSSNLNWKAGDVVPNAVISKLENTQGRVQFTNAFGSTDVIVDSTGYWDDGAVATGTRFYPVEPRRLADTRTGYLAAGSAMGSSTRLGPGQYISFKANGGLPSGATTAVLNVTAVEPSTPGYISAFPAGLDLKEGLKTSLVNFSAGAIRPNMTIMPMGTNGEIVVFNASNGTIDILVDITGYFA